MLREQNSSCVSAFKLVFLLLLGADNIKSRIIFVCDRKVENEDPVLDTLAVCCFSVRHFAAVCETGVRLGVELHHETVLGILSFLLWLIGTLRSEDGDGSEKVT